MYILCITQAILVLVNLVFGEVMREEILHMEQQKIIGELARLVDSDIHSLVWSIEVDPHCSIDDIVNKENLTLLQSCSKTDTSLRVLRKLMLPNIFLVYHPYYRTYSKVKARARRKYHRHLATISSYSNLTNARSVSSWNDTFDVCSGSTKKHSIIKKCVEAVLGLHPCVKHFAQEVLKIRSKRNVVNFQDPLFPDQWHLKNDMFGEYDINVMEAWETGITGRGVTVCVIDDGLEWSHPDLKENYSPKGSYDLNADDKDPSPIKNGEGNEHGTRCAGEIAAVTNSVCGVGIAYRANISGIRALGTHMTDGMEAIAFIRGLEVNDIYSCSWGPNDDGQTVDGPHRLARMALSRGVTYGRKGYGAIYVVASGNGGKNEDNCNYDGYANSVYTVTIGAVDSKGRMPYYAEECATMLAVAPSSGSNGRGIVTTDWHGSSSTGCTWQHSGTSAAAPIAAGVIALALEKQPCLSWRDIQYLIALSSRKIDERNKDWTRNRAGLWHSHQHGFGMIDASRLVTLAGAWDSVPFSTKLRSPLLKPNAVIPADGTQVQLNYTLRKEITDSYGMGILEFVQVFVTIEHEIRGSLKISLVCPSGTTSVLGTPRKHDNSTKGFQNWPLGTVRCLGETPYGTYTLSVQHNRAQPIKGKLISWRLLCYGTPLTHQQFQDKIQLADRVKTYGILDVNTSSLCRSPESHFEPFTPFSERLIKILLILGLFFFFMAIYNSLEYVVCFKDHKQRLTLPVRRPTDDWDSDPQHPETQQPVEGELLPLMDINSSSPLPTRVTPETSTKPFTDEISLAQNFTAQPAVIVEMNRLSPR